MSQLLWGLTGASLARIYSVLCTVALLFLTARILGPESQGVLLVIIATTTLLAQTFSLSLGQSIQFNIQSLDVTSSVSQISARTILAGVILSSVAVFVTLILYHYFGEILFKGIEAVLFLVGVLLIPVVLLEEYLRNLLIVNNRLKTYNILLVLSKSALLVSAALVLLVFDEGLMAVILVQILSGLVLVLSGALFIKLNLSDLWSLESLRESWRLCVQAAPLHVNTIATYLMIQSTVIILNYHLTKSEVAWYQMAFQMVLFLIIIPQSATSVLYERMAKIGTLAVWKEQRFLLVILLALMAVIGLVAYLLAPILVRSLLGEPYAPVSDYFRMLIPVVIGLSFAQIMAPQWIGRGLYFATSFVTAVSALLSITMNMILIREFGVLGAIFTSLAVLGFATVLVQAGFAAYCEREWRKTFAIPKV